MKTKAYLTTVTVVFVIVATVHFLRIIFGWPVWIGTLGIPIWASWLGVIFIGLLAYHGFRLQKRN